MRFLSKLILFGSLCDKKNRIKSHPNLCLMDLYLLKNQQKLICVWFRTWRSTSWRSTLARSTRVISAPSRQSPTACCSDTRKAVSKSKISTRNIYFLYICTSLAKWRFFLDFFSHFLLCFYTLSPLVRNNVDYPLFHPFATVISFVFPFYPDTYLCPLSA